MASLTGREAYLILMAFVADCESCGGRGFVESRHRRQLRKQPNARSRPWRKRKKPCWTCGYQARLARQLVANADAEADRRAERMSA